MKLNLSICRLDIFTPHDGASHIPALLCVAIIYSIKYTKTIQIYSQYTTDSISVSHVPVGQYEADDDIVNTFFICFFFLFILNTKIAFANTAGLLHSTEHGFHSFYSVIHSFNRNWLGIWVKEFAQARYFHFEQIKTDEKQTKNDNSIVQKNTKNFSSTQQRDAVFRSFIAIRSGGWCAKTSRRPSNRQKDNLISAERDVLCRIQFENLISAVSNAGDKCNGTVWMVEFAMGSEEVE